MASSSSHAEKLAVTPRSPSLMTLSPLSGSARVLSTHLSDEVLWKRLKESGFDEESIKRRDKAALIAYIAKLEAELYEHQHHMGLLLIEKNEWLTNCEEAKSMAESTELKYKRLHAAHISDLADAKKREDRLRKAIGIEKECLKNVEKTLHEMHAEYAEVKVAAESKYVEARSMVEDANKKLLEADDKRRAAESLESEASRYHRIAERKLREVEERADEFTRRQMLMKSDLDDKEKELQHERKSLSERQKAQQLTQERLLDGQALLNQRKEYIFNRTQELERFEKKVEDLKSCLEKDEKTLNEDKVALEIRTSSLSAREEAVIKIECDLFKKEEGLLLLQAKLAEKESENIQDVILNQQATFQMKNSAFEAELVNKRKLVEEELNAKRRAWELRELDIMQREDNISDRERELEIELTRVQERDKELEERSSLLEEQEKTLLATEGELELKKHSLQQEKEEIHGKKLDLQKTLDLLEEKKIYVNDAAEKVDALKSEANEFLVLELKLKEEIDMLVAQKRELEAEADHLKEEKVKFEAEWELIDEKREQLAKEAERIDEERLTILKSLKDERNILTSERNAMRDKFKQDLESLSRDRESVMRELEQERSEWFSKVQNERADLLRDIELQKEDLNNCVNKRQEEIDSYLTERERELEEEKTKELQQIAFLKETVEKEMELVNSEMKKLDFEKKEINLDREKRDHEWAELKNSIDELKLQREKLERQRELLRKDRDEIISKIENLKALENLKDRLDSIAEKEMHLSTLEANMQKSASKEFLKLENESGLYQNGNTDNGFGQEVPSPVKFQKTTSPISAPFSWLKRCADSLLEQRQSNKKRRKEDGIATKLGLEAALCLTEDKLNASEVEHAVMLLNQTSVATEEASIRFDKLITIEEITNVGVERAVGDGEETVYHQKVEKSETNGILELETIENI